MKPVFEHPWQLSYKEAVELQRQMQSMVKTKDGPRTIKTIAAVDVSYSKKTDKVFAVVAVFDFPSFDLLEESTCIQKSTFPYIPGLLSFREGPPVVKAFADISIKPDVVMYDGQGLAHPRRLGLASHMGVVMGLPSIGCAKTRYIGEYKEPRLEAGSYSKLIDKKETIGYVVRTRTNVKPCFVSIGYKITLLRAKKIVLDCCRGYRLPEIARYVHSRSKELMSEDFG